MKGSKMKKQEALSVLKITGEYTAESIKLAYRKLCSEYHPDRNPMGLHMMQLINAAYEILKDSAGHTEDETENFGENIMNALRVIADLGLNIELCGTWIWVSGDTKPHKEILKSAGYKWAPKKMMWYYHSGERKSYSRGKYTIDEIRTIHGSKNVKVQGFQKVEAA
jgi:hypothetical protein